MSKVLKKLSHKKYLKYTIQIYILYKNYYYTQKKNTQVKFTIFRKLKELYSTYIGSISPLGINLLFLFLLICVKIYFSNEMDEECRFLHRRTDRRYFCYCWSHVSVRG